MRKKPAPPVHDSGIENRLAIAKRLWDWEPHEGQRKFLTLRLADGSEPGVLVAACGRRWGKTECLGMDIATRLLTETDLGQLIVAPTKDQADGLFDSVEEKIREVLENPDYLKEFPHVADFAIKRSPYCYIRRKSDGALLLSARSAGRNGRNLRGKGTTRKVKRFRAIIDEGFFVPDPAINEAVRPMLATVKGGGQLVLIGSPNGKRGVPYEMFAKGERQEGKSRSVRLPSSGNPIVDVGFLEEMRAELTDKQYRAEFLAEFTDAAGQVFSDASIEGGICEDDYGNVPLFGRRYVVGVDFGRRQDYTVVSVGDASSDGVRLVAWQRLQGLSWASQIETICSVLFNWGAVSCLTDATGNGDAITEQLAIECMARQIRCAIEPFVFTATSKPALIDSLVIGLERGQVKYPAHPVLLSELRNFEATVQTSGREKLEAARGHDDAVCSLALMTQAAAPFIARSGGVVVSTGGKRVSGIRSSEDIEKWSNNSSPVYSLRLLALAPIPSQLSRLLTFAYRFAPVRSVGAALRRLTSG